MKNVFVFLSFFVFFTMVVSSCSKDGGTNGGNCSYAWAADLQPEYNVITSAAVAYSQDPSAENCNALKAAYQDWIDALKPYGNCAALTGQDRVEWQQAVDDAEAKVATLCQ
jgi:hypothetical protein